MLAVKNSMKRRAVMSPYGGAKNEGVLQLENSSLSRQQRLYLLPLPHGQ